MKKNTMGGLLARCAWRDTCTEAPRAERWDWERREYRAACAKHLQGSGPLEQRPLGWGAKR